VALSTCFSRILLKKSPYCKWPSGPYISLSRGLVGSLFREKIGEIADIFKKNLVIKRTQSENMIRASVVFGKGPQRIEEEDKAGHLCNSFFSPGPLCLLS
jgi:hypothetical protein